MILFINDENTVPKNLVERKGKERVPFPSLSHQSFLSYPLTGYIYSNLPIPNYIGLVADKRWSVAVGKTGSLN